MTSQNHLWVVSIITTNANKKRQQQEIITTLKFIAVVINKFLLTYVDEKI